MRYDEELKRHVPDTLAELRQYFDDADPVTLGGDIEKANILATVDLLIDAAPGKGRSKPSISFTELVRMVLAKSKEMAKSVRREAVSELSDLEVLVEGAKLTRDPARMLAVAKHIEKAAGTAGINLLRAAQARALAQSLRLFAQKAN